MTDLLWPQYTAPNDLPTIESVPLAQRGLPGTTYELVTRAAATWPDRVAVSCLPDAERWEQPHPRTFTELAADVHRVANTLTSLGVGRGDAVALISPNCASMIESILGAEAVGVVASINPALTAEHAARLVELSAARVLIVAGPELSAPTWQLGRDLVGRVGASALLALRPTSADGAAPELEPLDGVQVAYLDALAATARADGLDAAPPAPQDIASYLHTGGTTGTPKLAAHTHANEVADAWMIAAGGPLDENSVLFAALPLFHANALVVTVMAPLLRGQHVVWAGPLGYRDPPLFGIFWKLVERYRVAAMSGVPTVYAVLAQVPVDADISSLRVPIVGAAPLPPAVRDAFDEHTGVGLLEGYGLTEATCATSRNHLGELRPGSVGQRMPYQHVKAVSIDLDTGVWTDVPTGEVGVLAISGPTVFPGYVVAGPDGPRPDPTGKVVDGWLDTGDLARVDADGYIYLVGRAKDLIIRGGHNIDPAVIEDALLAHPDVTGANAVGRPDEHAGEVPVCYVTLAPGAAVDAEALLGWAAEHVPEQAAAPKDVIVLDALPLTAVGKPFKPDLRRDAAQRAVRAALAAAGLATDAVIAELRDGQVVVTAPGGAEYAAVLDRFPIAWDAGTG